MKKIVLIDGHSILNRAFYGVPNLSISSGLHTNAIYGFLNIMFKILDEEKPEYLAVAFDLKAPTFRHLKYPEYKGTRKPMPEELREQVPVIKEVLTAMEIPLMQKEGYEADDLLGTVAHAMEAQGLEVRVISGDRDLLQLATEHIQIRIPKTKKTGTEIENYFAADVKAAYQLTPLQIIDLKGLMGDTSDNIPGLPGVGEKTAIKILTEFGSVENAYAHVEEIKPKRAMEALREHYDLAVLSKDLATIDVNSPFVLDVSQAGIENIFNKNALEKIKYLAFKNMISRFSCDTADESMEEKFQVIEELGEAETLFETLSKGTQISYQLFFEQEDLLALAIGDLTQIKIILAGGFLTKEYLIGKLEELLEMGIQSYTFGLKEQLLFACRIPVWKAHSADLKIALYLLNPLKSDYEYQEMALDYSGISMPSRQELLQKSTVKQMLEKDQTQAIRYMGYCLGAVLYAHEAVMEKLETEKMSSLFWEVEMPLVFTLFGMEQQGICVQESELREYGEMLGGKIATLETSIYEQAGEQFNINSPKQLGVILFEKMQMPGAKKTKSGYSTAAEVLEKLAGDHKIVQDILEYRQVAKLKSTYADGLAGCIQKDGRIHSTFQQTITATGRISSTEPNLQNIPIRMELGRMIRKVFVPKDGCVFLDADYSQIELRVLAHIAGDEKMIQAYKEAKDIHRITASQVFHVPEAEVTPLQRRNAKAVNFGIVYGISAFGLSEDIHVSRKEAAEYMENYFATYPEIKKFLNQCVEDARNTGYSVTMFGRRRPMPELTSGNFMQRSFGERVAMNAPIQGTAADIIKIAMNRVADRIEKEQLNARLLLQVHDELLLEVPDEEISVVEKIVKEEMEGAADLSVKLEIDMHTGKTWFDAK